MPLLDSFTVNHLKMTAPAVRVAKYMQTKSSDNITVFDLRFCIPNKAILGERGIHTLEHLFAGFMREHLNSSNTEIIDLSPMGCRTGFYMSVVGTPDEDIVAKAWENSMKNVLDVKSIKDIPELNIYQCGTFNMHSLDEAKEISQTVIDSKIKIMHNKDILLSADELKKINNGETI